MTRRGALAARRFWTGGILTEIPVDLNGLFRSLGIRVYLHGSGGVDAACSRLAGRVTLSLNAQMPPPRRRFTAAHELGHLVLGHAPVLPGRPRLAWQEREADDFASELLMPAWALRRDSALLLPPGQRELVLARRFRVSRQAMGLRLARLGCLPSPKAEPPPDRSLEALFP